MPRYVKKRKTKRRAEAGIKPVLPAALVEATSSSTVESNKSLPVRIREVTDTIDVGRSSPKGFNYLSGKSFSNLPDQEEFLKDSR